MLLFRFVTARLIKGSNRVKVYESKDIRNVGVVGHGDSGKTTLTAGLLFTAGATNRLLRVDEGNTITDFDEEEVQRHLDKALADLSEQVEVDRLFSKPASASPIGTPLWDVLGRVVAQHYPGARLLPRLILGFTDAPYFRDKGAIAYGFGLFSRALTVEKMSGRFHGNDERIDVESLALTTQAWLEVCETFLG